MIILNFGFDFFSASQCNDVKAIDHVGVFAACRPVYISHLFRLIWDTWVRTRSLFLSPYQIQQALFGTFIAQEDIQVNFQIDQDINA